MPIILILLMPRPRILLLLRLLLLLLPLLPAAWEPLSLALNSLRSGIFAPFMASAIIDRATMAAAASIYAPHLFVYTWSRLRIIPGWNEACGPLSFMPIMQSGLSIFVPPINLFAVFSIFLWVFLCLQVLAIWGVTLICSSCCCLCQSSPQDLSGSSPIPSIFS